MCIVDASRRVEASWDRVQMVHIAEAILILRWIGSGCSMGLPRPIVLICAWRLLHLGVYLISASPSATNDEYSNNN